MFNLLPPILKEKFIVRKAYKAFFSPPKYREKSTDRDVIESGNNYRIPFKDGELAVTTWGENGPAILLMHGWGGGRAQMTGFVAPLLEAGYRVVAIDQPAHGESDGEMTNVLEIAPTMDLVAAQEGPFEAIIAHSFGTLVTSYALANRDFPPPSRLIYLGSFNRLMDSLPRFQVLAGLSDSIMDGVRSKICEDFGQDVLDAIVNESMAQEINIPTLMFHDKADKVTPVEDSRAIARVWEHARLIETEGLNHRGALKSEEIHTQIIRFLKD
jgi:pimeloyl-ACP methyl ester carboxylesterase